MLRALRKSFTCTGRQRKGSHSRQRSVLLHMAECASVEKDFDVQSNVTDDAKRPPKGHESRRRTRHNSAASAIGRNNSMNDWQEIVTALKNVDRSRHNSTEQVLDLAETEPMKTIASEDDPTMSESQRQLSSNVPSRLTPSATPLLHRKNSFEAAKVENDSNASGERFISEYNVRLEPVIKICIPCQHDHGQFHAPVPTARVTSNSATEAIDADVNSNSAAALMMRSINMAPARVEVAVETPEAEAPPTVVSVETAAGDESFKRLALEPPPPTPEVAETIPPSPTIDKALNSNPKAGDRYAANATNQLSTNQGAAFVEVGEWTEVNSPTVEEIDANKEEKKTTKDDDEEDKELMEPASASEVETSRRQSQTLVEPDTVAHADAQMQETEPPDVAAVAERPTERLESKKEEAEEETYTEKTEDMTMELKDVNDKEDTIETESKHVEFEGEGSPTSTSIASFVDVYDKEPLHPTDDSKTTMNPLRRLENRGVPEETPLEQNNNRDVRVAPWLGANEPTTSADRWKRMKQIVKDREGAAVPTRVPDADGESASEEVDSSLQKLMKNLTCNIRKASGEDESAPINEELRHILSTLSSQDIHQRQELKSSSPKLSRVSRSPSKKTEPKRRFVEKKTLVLPPKREVITGLVDEGKQRNFSVQMELDASDAVVCSFLRPADRRVVAAAAKNNCTVTVSAVENQPKMMRKFLCVVRGPTRDQVARCINFLKDTFPKSYIRYNR